MLRTALVLARLAFGTVEGPHVVSRGSWHAARHRDGFPEFALHIRQYWLRRRRAARQQEWLGSTRHTTALALYPRCELQAPSPALRGRRHRVAYVPVLLRGERSARRHGTRGLLLFAAARACRRATQLCEDVRAWRRALLVRRHEQFWPHGSCRRQIELSTHLTARRSIDRALVPPSDLSSAYAQCLSSSCVSIRYFHSTLARAKVRAT